MSTHLPQQSNKHLLDLPLRASTYHRDPLIYIDRQSRHIQRNLQVLIDAQSEGLLAGLRGAAQPDGTPTSGSYTPPTDPSSSHALPTVPIRQPVPKKIGLRAAREGIFKSIYDLLKLREEEKEILTVRVLERTDALDEISGYSLKKVGLEEAISKIHSDGGSQSAHDLRQESHTLESEIHETETRLLQMKARHRFVLQELAQMENSVESKLSSYKESLSLLESDIRRFLQNPPVPPQSVTNDATFYTLNPKRRTLDMAQDYWETERLELRKRQKNVDLEIQALEAGGGVWKQVVGEVSSFEKRLKIAMRRAIQSRQSSESNGLFEGGTESDHVRGILEDLKNTTVHVVQYLDVAEEKDWKLLVCCIATELEALREAREMLLDIFPMSDEDAWATPEQEVSDKPRGDNDNNSQSDPLGADNPEPPEDLLRDTYQRTSDVHPRSDDDEDDEPDPAWLLPET
ncbi:hypothetical protein BDV25DRAFT_150724 [Aspergillus avenaceus]|uniref:Autophagy-related protein Atg28 n=1 Tax=Aspergillus avenaceus TaxID=36643 RepID=A0A5N6U2Y9_ASPAV|nr:hypothetical protein BDV25DRAFT_150724 [Aspergillus avenaceus]